MDGTLTPLRYRHVLLATDARQAPAPALAAGHILANRLGARLTAVAVRPSWQPAGDQLSAGRAGTTPDPAAVTVLEGVPSIEIVRCAESVMADLILMVRPGPGEQAGPGMAGLFEAVVRRADLTCLLLPPGPLRLGHMHVALDGSERGMKTLRGAWPLRKLSDNRFSAVHIEPISSGTATEGEDLPSPASLRLLGWMREVVRPAPPPPLVERRGDVVGGVLAGLSVEAGDVLVLGVRRGGPMGVDQSTGVGRRILAAACCAVLTIPL